MDTDRGETWLLVDRETQSQASTAGLYTTARVGIVATCKPRLFRIPDNEPLYLPRAYRMRRSKGAPGSGWCSQWTKSLAVHSSIRQQRDCAFGSGGIGNGGTVHSAMPT